jgi:hypothetical protein
MTLPATSTACGCCEGVHVRTPVPIANRPGLPAIAYRVGTYARFKQSMLAGLTRHDRPALAGIRTRDDADLAIALVDAWALVGDVLTFYIERTGNEHYLATATERRSIDGLVQLIGYRLQPGVAASTWLAFTLETATGAPLEVPIRTPTRVQSIPGPDERPQTFETVGDLTALTAWNLLVPRSSAPRYPATGDTGSWFAGAALDVEPGDLLLFVGADWTATAPDDRWDLRRIVEVIRDAGAQRTFVRWATPLENLDAIDPAVVVDVHVLRQRASLFGYNAPDPRLFSADVITNLAGGALTADNKEWVFADLEGQTIYLDTLYQGLEPGSYLVLRNPEEDSLLLAGVTEVLETQQAGYSISARVTGLVLDRSDDDLEGFGGEHTRGTTVLLDSQRLPLAEQPLSDPIAESTIPLRIELAAIAAPRQLIVRGRQAYARRHPDHELTIIADDGAVRMPAPDEDLVVLTLESEPEGFPGLHRWRLRAADGFEGIAVDDPAALVHVSAPDDAPFLAEPAVATGVGLDGLGASLMLEQPLAGVFDRTTVEVLGNVAAATHGETVASEVLGSGDGARSFQQFTLRKPPLSYVHGDVPGQIDTTLVVWVNGVRWEEVPSFFGRGQRDRVYITRLTDTGETVVQFGDGVTGARLPTGRDNVVATYRAGAGTEGHLAAGQLSLLMTRPLGVRSVTNPIAPVGAEDRQEAEDAQLNAPRSVLTLGRIVSLRDYEDFARDYPGISKAAAVWTWDGTRRGVLITVSGTDGTPVEPGGLVHDGLLAAIGAAGSQRVPLVVKDHRSATFRLAASIRVESDRQPEAVLEAAKADLTARFSFAQRELGEIVSLSGVYEALHGVAGVASADIDHLYRGIDARLEPILLADAPVDGDPPEREAAELLTLDPASLDDLVIAP